MFREMRRKKKALSTEAAKRLLAEERRGVLAVHGEDGYPYAIPVNYFYAEEEQRIYFHSARTGHKADALKVCDKVCFTVYGKEQIRQEAWAPYVQSVVVFGRCHSVQDPDRTIALVRWLAEKYYPEKALIDREIEASGKAVQMYEIEIEHLTGKEIQEK